MVVPTKRCPRLYLVLNSGRRDILLRHSDLQYLATLLDGQQTGLSSTSDKTQAGRYWSGTRKVEWCRAYTRFNCGRMELCCRKRYGFLHGIDTRLGRAFSTVVVVSELFRDDSGSNKGRMVAYQFIIGLPLLSTSLPILLPTIYLWIIDTVALQRGTWVIEKGTKLDVQIWKGLEIE